MTKPPPEPAARDEDVEAAAMALHREHSCLCDSPESLWRTLHYEEQSRWLGVARFHLSSIAAARRETWLEAVKVCDALATQFRDLEAAARTGAEGLDCGLLLTVLCEKRLTAEGCANALRTAAAGGEVVA